MVLFSLTPNSRLRTVKIETLAPLKRMEDWFGSEYYWLLYSHRDCEEAKLFIDNLIAFLAISPGSKILDCGCGRGRHSIYLNEKGFEVTGFDISEKNIIVAKKDKKENLYFHVHDMRTIFRANYYDAAVNLFTSFGYFENDSENNKVFKSIAGALKKNGWFVLDFMNAEKERGGLIPSEKLRIDGIDFEVKRCSENNFIRKEISVSVQGKKYSFSERVKTYTRTVLENFFTQNKMEVIHLFGDYQLSKFNEASSGRLILVGRKI